MHVFVHIIIVKQDNLDVLKIPWLFAASPIDSCSNQDNNIDKIRFPLFPARRVLGELIEQLRQETEEGTAA